MVGNIKPKSSECLGIVKGFLFHSAVATLAQTWLAATA